MAVIYLPEDRRWSSIGEGIGTLVGAYVGNQLKQRDDTRVLQGVTQIQAQAGNNPQDVPQEIVKQYGVKGLALYGALQKMQAQAGLARQRNAATLLDVARTQQIEETLPVELRHKQAETAKVEGEISQLPGKAALTAAETARAQAGTAEAEARTAETVGKTQQEVDQRQALVKMFALPTEQQDIVRQGIGFTTDQWNALRLQSLTGGPQGVTKGIQSSAATNAAIEAIPKKEAARQTARQEAQRGTEALPPQIINTTANASRLAQGLSETLSGVENDPKSTGGPVAWVKQLLTEQGFLQSDPLFAQLVANTHQLIQQAATSGGGFMSAERIKLAKDVSPSVTKGKVYSIFEANAIANDGMAYLQGLKQNYGGTKYNTTAIDSAIGQLQKIADRTGTLWSTRMTDKDGKQLPKQVLFYGGREVDPTTLKPVPNGAKELPSEETVDLGKGKRATGADINQVAREKGITPDAMVKLLEEMQ